MKTFEEFRKQWIEDRIENSFDLPKDWIPPRMTETRIKMLWDAKIKREKRESIYARTFAIVSQFNHSEQQIRNGVEVTIRSHKAPKSIKQARQWEKRSSVRCTVVKKDKIPIWFGCITYEEIDGKMVEVGNDVDSSG